MELKSRTEKSVANMSFSVINRIVMVVVKFLVRSVFIYTLGGEYLGVNGLFASILSLLSLADLGFGIALPFSLYKPLAEKDTEKVKVIMAFYSKVYMAVGGVIVVAGASLTPFLGIIIKDMPDIDYLWLIYLLFVLNSASSYLFIYKRTLITADQKSYRVSMLDSGFTIALAVLQVIVLLTTRNYIAYLILGIVVIISKNIYISHLCNKMYPYVTEKAEGKLSKDEKRDMSKNIFSLFIYRVANVIEVSIDNIVISSFIGILSVGIYSNYLLIIDSLRAILMLAFNSLTASVGNVVANKEIKKTYNLFKTMNMMCTILYGTASIGIYNLGSAFITLWIGESYVLDETVLLVLCINLYIYGSQNSLGTFRNAFGLFWEGRYRPVVMTIANIVFSVVFVQFFGLMGVFLGTIGSRMVSVGIMDPYIMYKYGFKRPVRDYHMLKWFYGGIFLSIGAVATWVSGFIVVTSIWLFILKGLMIVAICLGGFTLMFFKTGEFGYITLQVTGLVRKVLKR